MQYVEIAVRVEPNISDYVEILTAVFGQIGFESFLETDNGFKAYIAERDFHKGMLEEAQNVKFPFSFRIEIDSIPDQNWNEVWEKNYFKPIQIDDRCVVRASFHTDFKPAQYEIIIDPKTAFGTGNHGTTYLLLEEILKLDCKGKSMLDMGCGTGILAILCKMRGASRILAVDNDPRACLNARENIEANGISDIEIAEGTAQTLTEETFDIIIENIWKNIVIADLPIISSRLKQNGTLIVSGFYTEDVAEVRNAAEKHSLKFDYTLSKDNWAIVKFTKQQ